MNQKISCQRGMCTEDEKSEIEFESLFTEENIVHRYQAQQWA